MAKEELRPTINNKSTHRSRDRETRKRKPERTPHAYICSGAQGVRKAHHALLDEDLVQRLAAEREVEGVSLDAVIVAWRIAYILCDVVFS